MLLPLSVILPPSSYHALYSLLPSLPQSFPSLSLVLFHLTFPPLSFSQYFPPLSLHLPLTCYPPSCLTFLSICYLPIPFLFPPFPLSTLPISPSFHPFHLFTSLPSPPIFPSFILHLSPVSSPFSPVSHLSSSLSPRPSLSPPLFSLLPSILSPPSPLINIF